MTCVLGLELASGHVLLVGDSGMWDSGESDVLAAHSGSAKVQRIRPGLVAGYAGVVGLGQRFLTSLTHAANLCVETEIALRWSIDAAHGEHRDDDDTISALVGVKDKLYAVTSDGSVIRPAEGFAGIGSYQYAFGLVLGWGAQEWGHPVEPRGWADPFAKIILREALGVQAKYSSSCVPPFVVVSTEEAEERG